LKIDPNIENNNNLNNDDNTNTDDNNIDENNENIKNISIGKTTKKNKSNLRAEKVFEILEKELKTKVFFSF
jgi:hypothetical protein